MDADFVAHFSSRVMPVAWSGCFEWLAGLSNGRATMRFRGRPTPAARVAYEIERGPIPAGKFVLHHCDNPRCVNPAHLYAGTNQDNANDAVRRGRHRTSTGEQNKCIRGHELSGANIYAWALPERRCIRCDRIRAFAYRSRKMLQVRARVPSPHPLVIRECDNAGIAPSVEAAGKSRDGDD